MTENIQKRGVKATTWDWEELQSVFTAEEDLYLLRERDIAVLLTAITPAMWSTRWFNQPALFGDIENFVGELNLRLMTPMDLCQLIADCLLDPDSPANAAVREVAGSGNGYPSNAPLPSDKMNENMVTGSNPTCDLDKLFGQCLYIIQTCDRLVTDFLERLDSQSTAELAVEIASKLPVIDESGLDAVLAYAQFLAEAIPENYAAQYTVDLENELACGLFCIAKDTCSLTLAQIGEYFADRLGVSLSAETLLEDVLTSLAGASLDGTLVVDAFFALIFNGLRVANLALANVGDSAIQLAMELGAGDPSDDWLLLCDDCSTYWEKIVDFTGASMPTNWAISTLNTNMGEHVAGVGIRTKAQNFAQVGVKYTAPTAKAWADTVDIEIKFDTVSGSITNGNRYLSTMNASNVVQQSATFANLTNTTGEQIVTSSVPGDADAIKYAESVFGIRNTSGSGSIVMKQIKFSGTGVNPFA